MGAVFSILSVLGKVILWLLGILFVLLLCILFYPIKYQLEAEFQQNVRMQGRIQWFWFFLRLHFYYQEAFQWKLRLFGLDLMKLLEGDGGTKADKYQKKREKKGKKREADKQAVQNENIRGQEEDERGDSVDAAQIQDGSVEHDFTDVGAPDRIEEEKPGIEKTVELSDVPSHQNLIQKIIQFVKRCWHKLSGFLSGAGRLCRRLRKKAEFAREMMSLFRSDNSKALVCIMKDNVVHLWRKLKPKVFRGHFLFGTGDPASTGEILGLFAILYIWYGDSIQIVPDFEEKVFEGEVFMKGKISVFTILLVLIRVFFSDEWKRFRQEYDRISASC